MGCVQAAQAARTWQGKMALWSGCGIRSFLEPGQLAVLASFFIFFLSLGNISSFVILYVYLQEDFEASAIETGWVGSSAWAVMFFLVPLPSALYARFGCQRVVLVGVLLASAGLLATSFASHLWVIYITYGLVFGAGSNFAITASINLVTSYYPRDNIRATSLVSVGQPVGFLVISASMEQTCFYLGWRNGIRIASGITLAIGMICTALLRQSPTTGSDYQGIDCKPSTSTHDPEVCSSAVCNGATLAATGDRSPGALQIAKVIRGTSGKNNYQPVPTGNENGSKTDNSSQGFSKNTRQNLSQSSTELDRESNPQHFGATMELELRLTSSLSNLKADSPQAIRQSDTQTGGDEIISDDSDETPPFTGRLREKCNKNYSDSEQESLNLEALVQTDSATTSQNPTKVTFFVRYVEILRLPVHWLFFGGIVGSSLAALFNVIHFVSFAGTVNISEHSASRLLIIMSGMEIATRVLIFICGNRVPVSLTVITAIVCVVGALATYGLVLLPTFTMVTLYVILVGFVRGTLYGIAFGATVDTFGVDRALEAYTSLLLAFGIAGALVSTVGISKDLTGKFTFSLHIIAVLFLLSAILFTCAHAWRKRNPLIGRPELIECDVNANDCDDEKHIGRQENGEVAANGVAVTAV